MYAGGCPINFLFRKGRSFDARFTILLAISLFLIFADQRSSLLVPLRNVVSVVVAPVHHLVDMPRRIAERVGTYVRSTASLVSENDRLKENNLLLEQKLQKVSHLDAENTRLRELMNSSKLVDDPILVAEVIGIDPDPVIKKVLLNQGTRAGIYPGQPLLDATGVMGQIVQAGPFTSRAILITDADSRIPVQINRNGYRTIASGSSEEGRLLLQHVPPTTDIKVGDLLVTSGMGQRFPVGYPVARITKVDRPQGQPFLAISAKPLARLDRSRLVMLVFSDTPEQTEEGVDNRHVTGEGRQP